jgi:hypothetical protein
MRVSRRRIVRGDAGKLDAKAPQDPVVIGIGNRELPHGLGKRSREFQVYPGPGEIASRDQVGEKIPGVSARKKTREQPGDLPDIGLIAGHCVQKKTTFRK